MGIGKRNEQEDEKRAETRQKRSQKSAYRRMRETGKRKCTRQEMRSSDFSIANVVCTDLSLCTSGFTCERYQ
jgi:hypothetical protein